MQIVTEQFLRHLALQINKIVIGNADIDTLPEIREQVKKMGIDDVIKAYSAALKRYNNK